ncbi:MAG: AAA family ATPase [Deltaproteobacteria bacterium]|nr:AAA family ATPase [Deltaproteobacteria bacterium]
MPNYMEYGNINAEMYKRALDLRETVRHKSIFLFGPRQTGKSTLVRETFPDAAYYDLLEADTFRELSARPEYLRQTLKAEQSIVVVDEVQKLPALLDEIQLLLDRNKKLRFVLTGSSARKLKRGAANLLGGRAWICRLHPLVSIELDDSRLLDRLNRGSLPAIIDSEHYREDLKAYVGTYLREEIRAEGLTRSIENFSRFLEVAGLTSGEQINFAAVADDAGFPPRTVREHYQILEDTLVGHQIPAYQKTSKRKPVATAKFFFFDIGVTNTLKRIQGIEPGSDTYGRALEHLVFLELRGYLDYRRLDHELTYWRSRSQFEVDFVVGDQLGVEVKSKARVSPRDYKGLLALGEEVKLKRKLVVCGEKQRRRADDGVEILPPSDFFRELWAGNLLD